MANEPEKKLKTITLLIQGKEVTIDNSDEINKEHMVKITCSYEDEPDKSIWIHVKDLMDNIRMKGQSFTDGSMYNFISL
jgi:hypothetical protein